jgi:hypothetical protein
MIVGQNPVERENRGTNPENWFHPPVGIDYTIGDGSRAIATG